LRKPKQEFSLEDDLRELVRLKVVSVKGGRYVFSRDFTETVNHIKKHPPSKFRQLRVGGKIARRMKSLLLSTARLYGSRRDVENLIVAFFCLDEHLRRLKLKVDQKRLPWLAFAVWSLDNTEDGIEVEQK